MSKKYKVYVYAITKNEEKFVSRWVESMSEADAIYVLDTGSSDDTVNKLKELGVNVIQEVINPWRFDVARNKSLELVPSDADICVCTDLDEVFEKGWREKLEENWKDDITRASYNYNWSFDEYDNPSVNFYIEKIHSHNDYKWTHPVHEVLSYIGENKENKIVIDDITLNHYPDRTKSRSSYLPLLELSVKEDETDDRNMHYLGREYMYYGKWNEAIDTLIKHLSLPKATWRDERCASMRFIARCYINLKRYNEVEMWLNKAIEEAPYLRDPYMEMALFKYQMSSWDEVIDYCNKALSIKSHAKTYINEPFSWNYTVYDLLSIALYYKKDYQESLRNVDIALSMNPNDERLLKNKEIIAKEIKI